MVSSDLPAVAVVGAVDTWLGRAVASILTNHSFQVECIQWQHPLHQLTSRLTEHDWYRVVVVAPTISPDQIGWLQQYNSTSSWIVVTASYTWQDPAFSGATDALKHCQSLKHIVCQDVITDQMPLSNLRSKSTWLDPQQKWFLQTTQAVTSGLEPLLLQPWQPISVWLTGQVITSTNWFKQLSLPYVPEPKPDFAWLKEVDHHHLTSSEPTQLVVEWQQVTNTQNNSEKINKVVVLSQLVGEKHTIGNQPNTRPVLPTNTTQTKVSRTTPTEQSKDIESDQKSHIISKHFSSNSTRAASSLNSEDIETQLAQLFKEWRRDQKANHHHQVASSSVKIKRHNKRKMIAFAPTALALFFLLVLVIGRFALGFAAARVEGSAFARQIVASTNVSIGQWLPRWFVPSNWSQQVTTARLITHQQQWYNQLKSTTTELQQFQLTNPTTNQLAPPPTLIQEVAQVTQRSSQTQPAVQLQQQLATWQTIEPSLGMLLGWTQPARYGVILLDDRQPTWIGGTPLLVVTIELSAQGWRDWQVTPLNQLQATTTNSILAVGTSQSWGNQAATWHQQLETVTNQAYSGLLVLPLTDLSLIWKTPDRISIDAAANQLTSRNWQDQLLITTRTAANGLLARQTFMNQLTEHLLSNTTWSWSEWVVSQLRSGRALIWHSKPEVQTALTQLGWGGYTPLTDCPSVFPDNCQVVSFAETIEVTNATTVADQVTWSANHSIEVTNNKLNHQRLITTQYLGTDPTWPAGEIQFIVRWRLPANANQVAAQLDAEELPIRSVTLDGQLYWESVLNLSPAESRLITLSFSQPSNQVESFFWWSRDQLGRNIVSNLKVTLPEKVSPTQLTQPLTQEDSLQFLLNPVNGVSTFGIAWE